MRFDALTFSLAIEGTSEHSSYNDSDLIRSASFFALIFSFFSGEGLGANSVGTHCADLAAKGLAADVAKSTALLRSFRFRRGLVSLGRSNDHSGAHVRLLCASLGASKNSISSFCIERP